MPESVQCIKTGANGSLLTGVATTISGCARSVAACACRLSPPTTSAAWMSVNCASRWIMLCTCAWEGGVNRRGVGAPMMQRRRQGVRQQATNQFGAARPFQTAQTSSPALPAHARA